MNFFYELSLFYNEMTKNLGVVKIYEKSIFDFIEFEVKNVQIYFIIRK